MPRPRLHDLDLLLDAAEELVAERGQDGVTLRTLAAVAGVPNGTIYHAFGSLNALLGQVWLRAADRFLRLQENLVNDSLAGRMSMDFLSAGDAVVAAALAPAEFAESNPAAARMLLTVRREQLLGPDLPTETADALIGLDTRLVSLLKRLAELLWGRGDSCAVEVVTTCVVDLPTSLLRRTVAGSASDGAPIVGQHLRACLAAAVLAVLAIPPPTPGSNRRPATTGEA